MFHLVILCIVLSSGCGLAQEVPSGPPKTIKVSNAYFDANTEVQYYDFGTNTNFSLDDPTAPSDNSVWILVRGFQANTSKPILVDGQLPIFGSLPGQSGYSDIRRISWVVVDNKYVADTWQALDEISGNVSITQTPQIFVNMAVVTNGSTIEGPMPFPIRYGYYRRQKVAFVSAGVTLPIAPPAYMFFKPGSSTPSGKPVISVQPGHVNYTGFWDIRHVDVPADYAENSARSEADAARWPSRRTGSIANWPVVGLANGDLNATAAPSPDDPSRSPVLSKSASSPSSSSSTPAPSSSASSTSAPGGTSGPTKSAAAALTLAFPTLAAILAIAFF